MKKILSIILVLLLVLPLLTSCLGKSDGGDVSDSDTGKESTDDGYMKSKKEVVPASELISLKDAEALLGEDLRETSPLGTYFADEASYRGKVFSFKISLIQEALYDETEDFDKTVVKDGWSDYVQKMEQVYEKNTAGQNITKITGIFGTSYLQEGAGFAQWFLHIFCDDYYIILLIGSIGAMDRVDTEDEIAWKHEKLIEGGKLAVERLKAIVG